MFNAYISNYISPLTQKFVSKYSRPENELDSMLTYLGIALLEPRIENYQGILGTFKGNMTSDGVMETIAECMQEYNGNLTPKFVYIDTFTGIGSVKARIRELFDLEELLSPEQFVQQELKMNAVGVFLDKENNTVYIISASQSMAVYHAMLAFLPSYYPNIFKDAPLTLKEKDMLRAICNRKSTKFLAEYAKVMAPRKKEILNYELENCIKECRNKEVNLAKDKVVNLESTADILFKKYKDTLKQLDEAKIAYEGLMVVRGKQNDKEDVLINYLNNNPNVHNISYNNGRIIYDITTLLTNIDIDKWNAKAKDGDIYEHYALKEDSVFKELVDRKLFMDSIFGENPEFFVKMRGRIILSPFVHDIEVPSHYEYDEDEPELGNRMTNPHLYRHGCIGVSRGSQIKSCLRNNDLISAVECSIAAVGSVNIGETLATFAPFCLDIMNSEYRVLTDGNGNDYTPAEALLWLKKNKENAA